MSSLRRSRRGEHQNAPRLDPDVRHLEHGLHPSVITTGQMLAALAPVMVYAVLVEGNPLGVRWTRAAVGAVLYLALAGSIAGAWLNYWLLKRTSATNLLLMGLVEPLVAVALGAAVLGETMSGRTVLGGIAIMISVAFVLDVLRGVPAPAERTPSP